MNVWEKIAVILAGLALIPPTLSFYYDYVTRPAPGDRISIQTGEPYMIGLSSSRIAFAMPFSVVNMDDIPHTIVEIHGVTREENVWGAKSAISTHGAARVSSREIENLLHIFLFPIDEEFADAMAEEFRKNCTTDCGPYNQNSRQYEIFGAEEVWSTFTATAGGEDRDWSDGQVSFWNVSSGNCHELSTPNYVYFCVRVGIETAEGISVTSGWHSIQLSMAGMWAGGGYPEDTKFWSPQNWREDPD